VYLGDFGLRKRWVALFLGMLLASAITAAAFITASYEDVRIMSGKTIKTSQFSTPQQNVD
jgi:hypothetical protein